MNAWQPEENSFVLSQCAHFQAGSTHLEESSSSFLNGPSYHMISIVHKVLTHGSTRKEKSNKADDIEGESGCWW
jgi:hypothetical protein